MIQILNTTITFEDIITKNKILFLLVLFLVQNFNVFAQTTSLISDCDDFVSGSDSWPSFL